MPTPETPPAAPAPAWVAALLLALVILSVPAIVIALFAANSFAGRP